MINHAVEGDLISEPVEYSRGMITCPLDRQATCLASKLVTRYIIRPVPVRAAAIRAMRGDLKPLAAPVTPAAPGTGPAAVAGELILPAYRRTGRPSPG